MPNDPAQARRANAVGLSTERRSRRCLQPVCSAVCSFNLIHPPANPLRTRHDGRPCHGTKTKTTDGTDDTDKKHPRNPWNPWNPWSKNPPPTSPHALRLRVQPQPNDKDHRPRATEVRIATQTRSRGSVHPLVRRSKCPSLKNSSRLRSLCIQCPRWSKQTIETTECPKTTEKKQHRKVCRSITRHAFRRTIEVSDGDEPPLTLELILSLTAHPRSLHRLVRHVIESYC